MIGYDDSLGMVEVPIWAIIETAKAEAKKDGMSMLTGASLESESEIENEAESENGSLDEADMENGSSTGSAEKHDRIIGVRSAFKQALSTDRMSALTHFKFSKWRNKRPRFLVAPKWYALRKTSDMKDVRGDIQVMYSHFAHQYSTVI